MVGMILTLVLFATVIAVIPEATQRNFDTWV